MYPMSYCLYSSMEYSYYDKAAFGSYYFVGYEFDVESSSHTVKGNNSDFEHEIMSKAQFIN